MVRNKKQPIPDGLVEKTKAWMGEDGLAFFRKTVKDHGEVAAVYMEGGIPHPVHLREGMQVRNFMRESGLCPDWGAHELDDSWVSLVELCIKED